MASRRGTRQQTKAITVGAEGSLLINYLAIQSYVLSVQRDVFSTYLIKSQQGGAMSQQAAAGRGGSGRRYYPQKGGIDHVSKAYKSAISEIGEHTFNTGHNKYAAQFTRSRKEIANYVQRMLDTPRYLSWEYGIPT